MELALTSTSAITKRITRWRPSEAEMCKVLIADDSEIMRTAIRKMLQEESHIDVVGEASSFADTMQKIAS